MIGAKRNRSGFSLLELAVVLLIVVVLAFIAVESYAHFRKARQIRTAAESLNSVFVAGRSYAITTKEWHRVVIQFKNPVTGQEEYSYWVDEIDPMSNTDPDASPPPAARKAKVTTPAFLPETIRIHEASVRNGSVSVGPLPYGALNHLTVRFKPDGSSDDATFQLIEKVLDPNQDSNFYSLRIYGPTAKCKIFPEIRK